MLFGLTLETKVGKVLAYTIAENPDDAVAKVKTSVPPHKVVYVENLADGVVLLMYPAEDPLVF